MLISYILEYENLAFCSRFLMVQITLAVISFPLFGFAALKGAKSFAGCLLLIWYKIWANSKKMKVHRNFLILGWFQTKMWWEQVFLRKYKINKQFVLKIRVHFMEV